MTELDWAQCDFDDPLTLLACADWYEEMGQLEKAGALRMIHQKGWKVCDLTVHPNHVWCWFDWVEKPNGHCAYYEEAKKKYRTYPNLAVVDKVIFNRLSGATSIKGPIDVAVVYYSKEEAYTELINVITSLLKEGELSV